jgi:molybdopterin-binding protein
MKISARNLTTTLVQIDVGGGSILTASITKTAADDLKLKVGNEAVAIIKASDVMVGVL